MRHFILYGALVLAVGVSWAVAQNVGSPRSLPGYNETAKVISNAPKQRIEVGLVRWGRDLEVAQKESAESGKPILLLFQEVPG